MRLGERSVVVARSSRAASTSCDIVTAASRVQRCVAAMKIPTLSPLSIFGFGQESTPVSSEPGSAATTSQCQGYPGPGRRARGDVLHGAASSMSLAESESMSQDMEPLSPVTREYRRRPRNLSSELTEPKVSCSLTSSNVKPSTKLHITLLCRQ